MAILNSSNPAMFAASGPLETRAINAKIIDLSAMAIGCWAIRFAYDRRKAYSDARAVFLVFCIFQRSTLVYSLSSLAPQWHVRVPQLAWSFGIILVTCHDVPETVHHPLSDDTLKALPTKHSFSYSYLYVGIPVGWRGQAGSILSADGDIGTSRTHKAWFSVAAGDYLERGSHEDGLKGKLQAYLTSQGLSPHAYPHAYLVTAPRFLGFSFNPVSFWYLYDNDQSLTAMILEVNNTFDERRMYFMERRADSEGSKKLGVKFAQEWPKDFHVSPFNDRGGAYSVQSTDPFTASTGDLHTVDNNIVLKSEDGKPKVIARVFSTEPSIDARTMTAWETLRFVLRWWWVGFMTNPRILKEARTLWAKKLQVHYRPEVTSSSIGRNETSDEVKLEGFFRDLLHQMAAVTPSTFHYTAAAGVSRAKRVTIHSTLSTPDPTPCSEAEIYVLTPAFYGELVRCGSLVEAFDRYCFRAGDGEAMVHCTHPEVLREALTGFSASLQSNWHNVAKLSRHPGFHPLRQRIVMAFRSVESAGHQSEPPDFDLAILRSSSRLNIRPYYSIALKLLLADRTALGWMPILKLEEICVWSLLVLFAASATGDLLGSRCQSPRHILPVLLKLCGIHIWSALITAA